MAVHDDEPSENEDAAVTAMVLDLRAHITESINGQWQLLQVAGRGGWSAGVGWTDVKTHPTLSRCSGNFRCPGRSVSTRASVTVSALSSARKRAELLPTATNRKAARGLATACRNLSPSMRHRRPGRLRFAEVYRDTSTTSDPSGAGAGQARRSSSRSAAVGAGKPMRRTATEPDVAQRSRVVASMCTSQYSPSR